MEELFTINVTKQELNIIENIIGSIIKRGKYEKGDWNSETTKRVNDLLSKVERINDNAFMQMYSE